MIHITTEIPKLDDIEGDIRSSTIRSINKIAADAAFTIRDQLPSKFTLRNNWIKHGIRYTKATETEPYALVYSRDPFMVKQEEGGNQTKGLHRFAIPKSIRSSDRMLIPRRNRPKNLLRNKQIFITKKGDPRSPNPGIAAIYERKGKTLRMLYLLAGKRSYQKRWGFYEQVEGMVIKKLDNFRLP